MDTLSIDQSAPMLVKRPATVADVCALVNQARAAGQGVYPVGGRTTLDVGLPPIKPGIALDTTALNQIIDYPARDMTITVQAGITIAAIQAELAKEGQWLPIDVPSPEKATLGGAIALNKSGPRRYGYGTLRDYVIGISFVTDDGVEVKAGGRVVKNVAGYDLMKLQIGAVGTLGVITQVTLKVKPKPEAAAMLTIGCRSEHLADVLDRLHASRTRPVAVELTHSSADMHPLWGIMVMFEEKAATTEWQVSTLLDELRAVAVTDVSAIRGADAADRLRVLTERRITPPGPRGDGLSFKANILPSHTAQFCNNAPRHGVWVHAHALSGIVYGHTMSGLDESTTALERVTAIVAEDGGNIVVTRCPTRWKHNLAIWGRKTADRELMRTVKKTLDPDNVFNPGRLFGSM